MYDYCFGILCCWVWLLIHINGWDYYILMNVRCDNVYWDVKIINFPKYITCYNKAVKMVPKLLRSQMFIDSRQKSLFSSLDEPEIRQKVENSHPCVYWNICKYLPNPKWCIHLPLRTVWENQNWSLLKTNWRHNARFSVQSSYNRPLYVLVMNC